MMNSIRDSILEQASDMDVGDRAQHGLCPFCHGGSSHERSFLMWKDDDGVAYKCYRAKCGEHGKIYETAKASSFKVEKKSGRKNTSELNISCLPSDCANWLGHDKFQWLGSNVDGLGLLWDDSMERVLLPIANPSCKEGYIARYYPELAYKHSSLPKAIAYYHTGIECPTCLMFPPAQMWSTAMVLVEDYWSAARLSIAGVSACALGGTHITEAALKLLLDNSVDSCLIILDSDAVIKADMMVMKYQLLFSTLSSIKLKGPDIKDMSEAEFSLLKQEIEQWTSSLR